MNTPDISESLRRELAFIMEADKLKSVFRQTLLACGSRRENDAEHSWHLALMAVLLHKYSDSPSLDLLKVIKMVLIHDIVEIDCGDTFCYDLINSQGKYEREKAAAERIFSILPDEQGQEFKDLWEEFEARETDEAKFANALDRLQPIMHNYANAGGAWKEHHITFDRVMERNRHIGDSAPELWAFAEGLIRDAAMQGYLEGIPEGSE